MTYLLIILAVLSLRKQTLIAIDQYFNALIGGMADETVSARAWRLRSNPYWNQARVAIDTVFFWQPNHCQKSYDLEVNRKQLPAGYSEDQFTDFGN